MDVEDDDKNGKRAKLKRARERLSQYDRASKTVDVKALLRAKGVAKATVDNWIRDPAKIDQAYRWRDFVEVLASLPDLDREKRNNAYDFALAELGLSSETQSGLAMYGRGYIVYHDFQQMDFNSIRIKVESEPMVATFAFKYWTATKQREICDGLVIERQGRLLLTGFSSSTAFHAFVLSAPHPERQVMQGMAFIEDLRSNEVSFSKIALLAQSAQSTRQKLEQIDSHVRKSRYTLRPPPPVPNSRADGGS